MSLKKAFDKASDSQSSKMETSSASNKRISPSAPADANDPQIAKLKAIQKASPKKSPPSSKMSPLVLDCTQKDGTPPPPVPPLPGTDPMLTAISKQLSELSLKFDKVAMKTDLDEMGSKLASDTKVLVAEAVDPIKSEVYDLKQRVTTLEAGGPPDPKPSTQTSPPQLQKLVNSLDPAKKRVAFLGWPDTFSADARIKHIEALLSQHAPAMRVIDIDNIYQGPYGQRTLTKGAYAEFPSPDSARRALNLLKDAKKEVGDTTISIKPARTKINSQRNYSLKKAEELIKSSPDSQGKQVSISWDTRAVTVNQADAFTQSKGDNGGTFLAPYDQLSLP